MRSCVRSPWASATLLLLLSATTAVAQYKFTANSHLRSAVNQWTGSARATAESTYGHISTWDTSEITDMSLLFKYKFSFNDDISNWDTSRVRFMNEMFLYARAFDQDIGDWDVSSVTNMRYMFTDANAFNQDLSAWDVSSVTDMFAMFSHTDTFNEDITTWDVSGLTDMSYMFSDAIAFNQDISNWDVSSVVRMFGTFSHTRAFDQDISSWDTSRVTSMAGMFYAASVFNQDINSWDVSSVTSLTALFYGSGAFDYDLSSWDVTSVKDMNNVFTNAQTFSQDICWDLSQNPTRSSSDPICDRQCTNCPCSTQTPTGFPTMNFLPPIGTDNTPAAPVALCSDGITNDDGTVCCAQSCGVCGGCDCSLLPGGADDCCPGAISTSEIYCTIDSDVGCLLDVYVTNSIDGSCG